MAGGHPRCRLRTRSPGCDRLCRAPATRGASHLVAGTERRHRGRMTAPSAPTTGHAQPLAAVLLQRFSSTRRAWRAPRSSALAAPARRMGLVARQRGIRHRCAARRGSHSQRRPARPRSGRYIEVAAEVLGRTLFPRGTPALRADSAQGEERRVVGAGRPGEPRGGRRSPGVRRGRRLERHPGNSVAQLREGGACHGPGRPDDVCSGRSERIRTRSPISCGVAMAV